MMGCKNIAFTDSTGRYLIFGALFDSATRQVLSMTAPVSDAKEANLVAFPEAHLADALKTVRGNGSRVFAVFSDPNCGYCKSLEKELTKLDNVTIYTFMVPFLSDDSLVKGNTVWCSSDRNKAWAAVIQGKPLRRVLACESPLERNRTLAQRLVVNGTPTLVSVDGRTHAGYSSAVEITQWLAAVQIKESSK